MRRGRIAWVYPSVEAENGDAEGQNCLGIPLRQGGKRRCGGVELLGYTPPSRQKTAMRRGRIAWAYPSVEAENGDAEGLERSGEPLRVDFLK